MEPPLQAAGGRRSATSREGNSVSGVVVVLTVQTASVAPQSQEELFPTPGRRRARLQEAHVLCSPWTSAGSDFGRRKPGLALNAFPGVRVWGLRCTVTLRQGCMSDKDFAPLSSGSSEPCPCLHGSHHHQQADTFQQQAEILPEIPDPAQSVGARGQGFGVQG